MATRKNTTVSRFHNLSDEALADAIGRADAIVKGAEAALTALKDEFKARGIFGTSPALAVLHAAAMLAKPANCAPDPVYAAIAEHKRANAAFTVICAKYEDFGPDDMTEEQNYEYDAAMEADDAALEAVARTV